MTEKLTLQPPSEVALLAENIDLIQVAKATGGNISFLQDSPVVNWANERRSLEWRDEYDGLQKVEGKKTLFLWAGEWGRGGLEHCGLVTGKDFIAFVYPKEELCGEIITRDGISSFKGPDGIYNPLFLEARALALAKLQARTKPL